MLRLLWDASGLAKRSAVEIGTPTAMALWSAVPSSQMVSTFSIYAETYSILVRKHNRREISNRTFEAAKLLLRREVIYSLDFILLAIDTADILAGLDLIDKHHINSSDAAIRAAYLRYIRSSSDTFVLVAADSRLCRAAQAEGLAVIHPETMPTADVPAFLAAL